MHAWYSVCKALQMKHILFYIGTQPEDELLQKELQSVLQASISTIVANHNRDIEPLTVQVNFKAECQK